MGDAYIDRQGYIYLVKKGQVKPHEIVWNEARRRYNYYRFDHNGKRTLIPFHRVHASYLFWDPRSTVCKEFVKKYN